MFYTDHAYQRVLGREQLVERLDDSQYLNSWGLYDDSLYEMAVDEIRRLDRQQGPWNMTLLNLSAHAPAGYPSQACEAEQGVHDGVDILYAVKCSGWLTRRLLERLEDEQLLDNTLVVIASDHLTMRVSAWDQLIQTPRTNTLMMMGNALTPARISTQATTMDTLPTLLEAMGFTIDWHRAGLGVSLFSGEPTLAEQVGLEALNGYMREETALQERLWEGLAPAYRTSGQPDAPPEAPHQP